MLHRSRLSALLMTGLLGLAAAYPAHAQNVAPSFTVGDDQTVLEDAGPQSFSGWATGISAGPSPDEDGQTLMFNVTGNTNPGLFSAGPEISSNGTLTFTPAADANGSAEVTVTLMDNGGTAGGGSDTSAPQTFTITVTAVNDEPSFVANDPPAVLEDAGASGPFVVATGFDAGPDDEDAGGANAQAIAAYIVSNVSNPALFSVQPAVDNLGQLTFTPAPNANGVVTFDLQVQDTGGVVNAGDDDTSQPIPVTITITPVNDEPSFVANNPPAVLEDAGASGPFVVATGFDAGPDDEDAGGANAQSIAAYIVSNVSNPALFSVQPAVDNLGKLTFTPAANANGVVTFDLQVQDTGGVVNPGDDDTSQPSQVTITITPVNDAPTFKAQDQLGPGQPDATGGVIEYEWAHDFDAGPDDEDEPDGANKQHLEQYIVETASITNPALFAVPPAVNNDGDLTYTPAVDAAGIGIAGKSYFDVQVQDSGPGPETGNGDENTSIDDPPDHPKTFLISVPPAPDHVISDCTFDAGAFVDTLDGGVLTQVPTGLAGDGDIKASYIVIYVRGNPNRGQATRNSFGTLSSSMTSSSVVYTGPILCGSDDSLTGVQIGPRTTQTTLIPDVGTKVDILNYQLVSNTRYALKDTTGNLRDGEKEAELCHGVADNTDCFFIQPNNGAATPSTALPDRIVTGCKFDIDALRAALTVFGEAGDQLQDLLDSGEVEATDIVIYNRANPNLGQALTDGGYSGPVLCIADNGVQAVWTDQSADIPDQTTGSMVHGGAASVDFLPSLGASHLQYEVVTPPGDKEVRVCHSMAGNGNTDCFVIKPATAP